MANYADLPLTGINFEVFYNSNRLLGLSEISLPDLEMLTAEISGAGVAGKFNAPVIGYTDSMEMEMTWRTIVGDLSIFAQQRAIDIICYGAMEKYDASTGALKVEQVKIAARVFNKKIGTGTLKAGEQTETKTTLEVIQMKLDVGGKPMVEFDKVNSVFKVDGVDYLSDVKRALNI